jgi:hypothetical protein
MNYLKVLTGGLALGCSLLLTTGYSFAAGQIMLADVEMDIEKICYIPAEPGTYKLRDMVECRSDDYNSISFNNVDSALTVTVFDARDCDRPENNWAFAVTTVKQPTTVGTGTGSAMDDWIKFNAIWLTDNNKVVVPGVMKQGRWKRPPPDTMPNLHNEASCVLVERK